MSMRISAAALLTLTLWGIPGRALPEPVQVEAAGSGPSRDEAVARALTEAIQQVTGTALNATQQMRAAMSASSSGDKSTVSLTEDSEAEISRVSHGIVRSYRIVAVEQDGPRYIAHLSVTVEKFEAKGLGNDSRRRIAVAEFATPFGSHGLSDTLRARLTADLTQARRFAVVDRANDDAYSREMAVIADAPLTERVRAGQVIGADYVVVGAIRQASVSRSNQVIELTGEHVHSASSALEVDFQVIEIATRQVKWGGSARLAAGGESLDGLVDRAAARIAESITQAIYPMRLIKFGDPAELIVNQGGEGVQAGQRFRAMLLGERLYDPYTKEPLGQTEREIGVIEVQRVDPKLSYARLVSGHLPPAGSQIVLRRAGADPYRKPQPSRPRARPIVKLPGDP